MSFNNGKHFGRTNLNLSITLIVTALSAVALNFLFIPVSSAHYTKRAMACNGVGIVWHGSDYGVNFLNRHTGQREGYFPAGTIVNLSSHPNDAPKWLSKKHCFFSHVSGISGFLRNDQFASLTEFIGKLTQNDLPKAYLVLPVNPFEPAEIYKPSNDVEFALSSAPRTLTRGSKWLAYYLADEINIFEGEEYRRVQLVEITGNGVLRSIEETRYIKTDDHRSGSTFDGTYRLVNLSGRLMPEGSQDGFISEPLADLDRFLEGILTGMQKQLEKDGMSSESENLFNAFKVEIKNQIQNALETKTCHTLASVTINADFESKSSAWGWIGRKLSGLSISAGAEIKWVIPIGKVFHFSGEKVILSGMSVAYDKSLQSVASCSPGGSPIHAEEQRISIAAYDQNEQSHEFNIYIDRNELLNVFGTPPFNDRKFAGITKRMNVTSNVDITPRPVFSLPRSRKFKKMPFYIHEALESYMHNHVFGKQTLDDGIAVDLILSTASKVFHWKPK